MAKTTKSSYWYYRRRYWRKRRYWRSIKGVEKNYIRVPIKQMYLVTPDSGSLGEDPGYKFSVIGGDAPAGYPKGSIYVGGELLAFNQSFKMYKAIYDEFKVTGVAVEVKTNLGTDADASNHVNTITYLENQSSDVTSIVQKNSVNSFVLPSAAGGRVRKYWNFKNKNWIDGLQNHQMDARILVECSPTIAEANIAHYERYNCEVTVYCVFRNNIFNK